MWRHMLFEPPSLCHKLSHLLGPPSIVTYFIDGPHDDYGMKPLHTIALNRDRSSKIENTLIHWALSKQCQARVVLQSCTKNIQRFKLINSKSARVIHKLQVRMNIMQSIVWNMTIRSAILLKQTDINFIIPCRRVLHKVVTIWTDIWTSYKSC